MSEYYREKKRESYNIHKNDGVGDFNDSNNFEHFNHEVFIDDGDDENDDHNTTEQSSKYAQKRYESVHGQKSREGCTNEEQKRCHLNQVVWEVRERNRTSGERRGHGDR